MLSASLQKGFWLLYSIPSCEYTEIHLLILLLMGSFVVSKLGLLRVMCKELVCLGETSRCISIVSVPGGELVRLQGRCKFILVKSHQPVFQSGCAMTCPMSSIWELQLLLHVLSHWYSLSLAFSPPLFWFFSFYKLFLSFMAGHLQG